MTKKLTPDQLHNAHLLHASMAIEGLAPPLAEMMAVAERLYASDEPKALVEELLAIERSGGDLLAAVEQFYGPRLPLADKN